MGLLDWPRLLPGRRRQHLRLVEKHAVTGCGKVAISGRYFHLPRRVEDDYVLLPMVLGRGVAGAVHLARSQRGNRRVAVKVFTLSVPIVPCLSNPSAASAQRLAFANEVEIALSMDHPHVGRLLGVYESERKLHMVMEYLSGGTLLDYMRTGAFAPPLTSRRFSEEEASNLAFQMLLAVNYMHSHGLVHRDLKPGNFVFEGRGRERGDLKLIDFGFSKHCKPGGVMQAMVGTMGYVAPEVLTHSYTSQCDLWSFGVIVFRMLFGHLPFEDPDESPRQRILEGNFRLHYAEHWRALSRSAKDFVKRLLVADPQARLTAEEALSHPWIVTRGGSCEPPAPELHMPRLGQAMVQQLQDYARLSRLERACRTLMTWSTETSERTDFAAAFEALDRNRDGRIQSSELEEALWDEARLPPEECSRIFRALDVSQNGELEYSEFVAALVSREVLLSERCLWGAFHTLDAGNHQFITKDDLRAAFGDSFDGAPISELLLEAGLEPEGRISYADFREFFASARPAEPSASPNEELSLAESAHTPPESPCGP